MLILWQYNLETHKFHGFMSGAFSSLCGVPRGGNPPIAETSAIPLGARCVLCEASMKREQKRIRAELSNTDPDSHTQNHSGAAADIENETRDMEAAETYTEKTEKTA